jgi:glutathione synthase/RimK-type ligase-like ATP-grasp enzyme
LQSLIVVDNPKNWLLKIPGIPVISGRVYLTDQRYSQTKRVKVFNLCRSYRYQSVGYYVSLLAQARGHTPLPGITTIQDMRWPGLARVVASDLEELIQRRLRRIKSARFTLSVYFGRNVSSQYDDLSMQLFRLFQAPLLRAEFVWDDDEWRFEKVRPIPASEIPDSHHDFVIEAATAFFARSPALRRRATGTRYDLAILRNEAEEMAPSDGRALQRFVKAGKRMRLGVELIDKNDYGRLGEFDGLFIRETTQVDHYTYRFARRAAADGMVVIDDPDSIIRCTNKVYLAELLEKHRVPIPHTTVVHRENRKEVIGRLSFPCIVKQPDSSFSQGVFKANDAEQFEQVVGKLLEDSELLIVQEFVPTEYDWRIGVLDRELLFACKYHMVKAHWQIARTKSARTSYGEVEAVAMDSVPPVVLKVALKAANAIGDGLYGVDVKLVGHRAMVIEVNDNPNIEGGCEDGVLKDELYERILNVFIQRIEKHRGNGEVR